MKTFPNQTKTALLHRMAEHRRLDQLIQGMTWDSLTQRGCAIGCLFHKYDHSLAPDLLGVPVWLAHLVDRLFENLPPDDARLWPEQFLTALPEGVAPDWGRIRRRFLARTLRRLPVVSRTTQSTINLLEREGDVTAQEWIDAIATAYSATARALPAPSAAADAANAAAWATVACAATDTSATNAAATCTAAVCTAATSAIARATTADARARAASATTCAAETRRQRDDILDSIARP